MNRKREKRTEPAIEYRSFPLYIILSCAIIVTFIGIYLTIRRQTAEGIPIATKYGESARQISVNGPSVIFIGIVFSIFPIYQLIRNNVKRKKILK